MKRKISFIGLRLFICLLCVYSTPIYALFGERIFVSQASKVVSALIRHPNVVSTKEIRSLAELGKKTGGTKEIGKILGAKNLPSTVLEDAYMRIAIQQNKITRVEAEGMMSRLSGTPGFRTTISKVIGNSDIKTAGHLNELRIADDAVQKRYKVKGIGYTFDDGIKSSPTDIDVLLVKNGRTVAIEAKNYLSSTSVPMDKFRADMDTLVEFARRDSSGTVLKVFSITNRPANSSVWRMLNLEAERRGVQLIEGTPAQQIMLIERLLKF